MLNGLMASDFPQGGSPEAVQTPEEMGSDEVANLEMKSHDAGGATTENEDPSNAVNVPDNDLASGDDHVLSPTSSGIPKDVQFDTHAEEDGGPVNTENSPSTPPRPATPPTTATAATPTTPPTPTTPSTPTSSPTIATPPTSPSGNTEDSNEKEHGEHAFCADGEGTVSRVESEKENHNDEDHPKETCAPTALCTDGEQCVKPIESEKENDEIDRKETCGPNSKRKSLEPQDTAESSKEQPAQKKAKHSADPVTELVDTTNDYPASSPPSEVSPTLSDYPPSSSPDPTSEKEAAAVTGTSASEENLDIPVEHSEIWSRLSRDPPSKTPARMKNGGLVCYANSVIQALSSQLQPDWLLEALGSSHVGPQSTWTLGIKIGRETSKQLSEDADRREFNPAHDFINLLDHLEFMDRENDSCVIYPFQAGLAEFAGKMWNGRTQEDAAEYLRCLLNMLSTGHTFGEDVWGSHPVMDALFQVQNILDLECRNKDCTDPYRSQISDDDWVLRLQAPGTSNAGARVSTSVTKLLEDRSNPEIISGLKCSGCSSAIHVTQTWSGLRKLPHIMVVQFDRATIQTNNTSSQVSKSMYDVEIEAVLPANRFVHGSTPDSHYSLRTVIKHAGRNMTSGHYTAFTKTTQGWWWCNDMNIKKVDFGQVLNQNTGGQIYLAFYQLETGALQPSI